MRIFLSRSVDVEVTLFNDVANFLKAIPGAVIIDIPESVINMFPEDAEEDWPRPGFDEFYQKCEGLRQFSGGRIHKDDVVVFLSGIPNDQNWFSAFQLPTAKRNIFICTEDWEYYLPESKVHFGIAYQVVENCMQVLMDLNYEKPENASYIHTKSRGCLNDFCGDKRDIRLKIQTANICETCLDKIKSYPDANAFLPYAHFVMNAVRDKFINRPEVKAPEEILNSFELEIRPSLRSMRLCLGGKTLVQIELSGLRFSLYYTIIKFSEAYDGISPNQLAVRNTENREVFDFIRRIYHNNENESAITKLGTDSDMFSQYRSKINLQIKNEITKNYPNRPEGLLKKIQISPSKNGIYKVPFGGKIRVIE